MSWTPERTTLLKDLWKKGVHTDDIAAQVGGDITRNAVIGKAHRLDLGPHGSASRPRAVPELAPPKPKPKPVVKEPRPVPIKKEKHTTLTLGEDMCRWPIGTPGTDNFHFCGEPVLRTKRVPTVQYCEKHLIKARPPKR